MDLLRNYDDKGRESKKLSILTDTSGIAQN